MSTNQVIALPQSLLGQNAILSNSFAFGPPAGFSVMHAQLKDFYLNKEYTSWRGSSGAIHTLNQVEVDDFILNDTKLYMLVAKNRAIWVGTAQDLIQDSASRSQFRQCTKFATYAFELAIPKDEGQKIQLIADLLSGYSISKLHAA